MKRSESMLVYAVTAVLAVILVVAVVFGNEGEAADREAAGGMLVGGSLADVLGGDPESPRAAKTPGGGPVDPQVVEVAGGEAGGEVLPGPGSATPVGPLRSTAEVPSLVSLLGPFSALNQLDGARYRVVVVQPGDTFSELVERWTGDLKRQDEVLALNEWVDPKALRAGEELIFPWVEDADLLLAYDQRRARRPANDPVPDLPAVDRGGLLGAADRQPGAGALHVLSKGETLWGLAAAKVGPGAATAYVDAILRANPSIRDAGAIRAGEKIVLPAVE